MLKKIIITVLMVAFTGALIWGGVNRTLARSTDHESSSNRGAGQAGGSGSGESHGHTTGEYEDHMTQDKSINNSERGNQGAGRGNGRGVIDETEIQALELALMDEVHALTLYQAVIAEFGEVVPFVELAESESRHVDALLNHFEKKGITVPELSWEGEIPAFETVEAACEIGAEAETLNIELYESLLEMTDDPGLTQVFSNLSRASRESHLPELQACQ